MKPSGEDIYDATQLKAEINSRALLASNYLDNLVQHSKSGEASALELETYKHAQQVANQVIYRSSEKKPSNKYAHVGMYSLLSLLENFESDGNTRKALGDTIASTFELEKIYENIRDSNPNATVDEFIERATKQLENLTAVTGTIYLTNGENSD